MRSVGFINAKITCKDCGSQVIKIEKMDGGSLFKCECQQFDITRVDLYSEPERVIAKMKKDFDALRWELEALE